MQAERAAFDAFEPDDFVTPGVSFEVLPCPMRLPRRTSRLARRWLRN